jgi:DNA polymerase-3 subunit epsilon
MIVVDVETTGFNPEKHSIVSIGAVDFLNPKNQFYKECQIWKGAEITKEASEINGFSEEEIKNPDKETLEEIIRSFLQWAENIKNKTIAGENPSFDRDFLKNSAQRYGIDWPFGYRTIDLHTLCYTHYLKRGLNPPTKNERIDLNIDKILVYVGLPEEPKPHNALVGARMEAEAISRLIYGKSLLKEFNNYNIPNYLL